MTRPRGALPALLLVLALPAALPAASACTLAMPAPLEGLAWPAEDAIHGSADFSWGRVAEGRLVASHPAGTSYSPDGRWAVFLRTGPKAPDPLVTSTDSCGFDLPRYAVVHDLREDRHRLLDAEPVDALDAGRGGVHVLSGGAMRAYAWGAWDAPRALPVPPDLAASRYPRLVQVADGGEAVAWSGRDGAARFAAGARELGAYGTDEDEHVARVAFSPDARHAALAVGSWSRGWRLVVVELREGLPAIAQETLAVREPPALAWGPRGLAASLRAPETETTPPQAGVRLYGDPLHLAAAQEAAWPGRVGGGLAWSPEGSRLAVGHAQAGMPRLVVLDGSTLAVLRDEPLEVVRMDWPSWNARLDAEAPAPQPRGPEKEGWGGREVSAPQLLATLAAGLAAAACRLSRRG